MTGKGLYGPLAASKMAVRPIEISTVAELLREEPELRIFRPRNLGNLLYKVTTNIRQTSAKLMIVTGLLPPFVANTLG